MRVSEWIVSLFHCLCFSSFARDHQSMIDIEVNYLHVIRDQKPLAINYWHRLSLSFVFFEWKKSQTNINSLRAFENVNPTSLFRCLLTSSSVLSILFLTSTPWRNGSASDSRSEGCVFKSRRGHSTTFLQRTIIVNRRSKTMILFKCTKHQCTRWSDWLLSDATYRMKSAFNSFFKSVSSWSRFTKLHS